MGVITDLFARIFRDFVIEGIPSSGINEPDKAEIRSLGASIEQAIALVGMGGLIGTVQTTAAALAADLAHDAGTLGLVWADPASVANDIYIKSGASGTGSWTATNLIQSIATSLFNGMRVVTYEDAVYSHAIVSSNGFTLALVEKATGKWKVALSPDSILPSQKGLMQIYDIDPSMNGGWMLAFLDQNNALLGGFKQDGTLVASLNAASILPRTLAGLLPTSIDITPIDDALSGWLLPVTDSAGKLLGGWKKDGTFVASMAPESILPSGNTLQAVKDTLSAAKMGLPSGRMYMSGDSMSVASGGGPNSYPSIMSAAIGLPYYSSAIGGTRSESIMVRQGGIPMLLTITGDTLPADTSEVDVTAFSAEWVSNNQGSQSITGLLAGQPVVLTHYLDGSNATLKYTVKRQAAAGSSTAIPPETRFDGDPYQGNELDYHYIWAGRNDDKTTRANRVKVRDNILRGIDRIKHDRFGIISICPTSVETIGTTDRGYVDETNQLILDAVGAHHWANMIDYMTSRGALDDAGLTPTSQDLIDVGNGIVPGSLRADQVHFNSAYGYVVAGNFMARWHRGHGWATGTLTL